ncbi:hypothetical protein D187_007068 [Cystobacter fuscus DSM 2262]|uniref:Uncharacterized protein n=1 Tax=Cystobacter fuscus (strain ATCC 25194 / DSM 2262 / NBRC 100088 / M29) TaxID=1242864 RepID=S9Q7K4_CYSF2|nr:hypothetical protein D187_007068 [Cystobacter fuscus DSM 2262]
MDVLFLNERRHPQPPRRRSSTPNAPGERRVPICPRWRRLLFKGLGFVALISG